MTTPFLIDMGPLCECDSDHLLEDMAKALSSPGDDDIWRPHESAFIRELIERATAKGISQIDALKTELMTWLFHAKRGAPAPKPQTDGMIRWSDNLMGAVEAYIAGIPQKFWLADDYVLLIDYLAQKYLPPDFALTQAQWLVRRSMLMGKVQTVVGSITPAIASTMLIMFDDARKLEAVERLAKLNQQVLDYGQAKCADYIVSLTDKLRHQIKATILEHEGIRRLGGEPKNTSLQQALLDNFADLNRDWRRIALTEAGEMANQGMVAGLAPGTVVKRIEQYANACPFCKKMDGKTFTVVSPAAKDKNWDTQIWTGKTNVGRSASPYKRVGGQLVKRSDDELWKPASGTFHPMCRGRWVPLGDSSVADEFSLWLDGFLESIHAERQKH